MVRGMMPIDSPQTPGLSRRRSVMAGRGTWVIPSLRLRSAAQRGSDSHREAGQRLRVDSLGYTVWGLDRPSAGGRSAILRAEAVPGRPNSRRSGPDRSREAARPPRRSRSVPDESDPRPRYRIPHQARVRRESSPLESANRRGSPFPKWAVGPDPPPCHTPTRRPATRGSARARPSELAHRRFVTEAEVIEALSRSPLETDPRTLRKVSPPKVATVVIGATPGRRQLIMQTMQNSSHSIDF